MFAGMPLHLLMVGPETCDRREQVRQAEIILNGQGVEVQLALRTGDVDVDLHSRGIVYNPGLYPHPRSL